MNFAWASPISISVALIMAWDIVGVALVPSMVLCFLIVPLNYKVTQVLELIQVRTRARLQSAPRIVGLVSLFSF